MNVVRYILVILLSIGSFAAYAQGNGVIEGIVADENGDPVIGAKVEIFSGGSLKGRDTSDADGHYIIKLLGWGEYDLVASHKAYRNIRITHIIVSNDRATSIHVDFDPYAREEKIIVYKKPTVSSTGKLSTIHVLDVDLTKLVATSAAVHQGSDNSSCTIKGRTQDQDKEPVIDAKVELFQGNTKISSATTDIDGNYDLGRIGPGTYRMIISHWMFKSITVEDIILEKDETITVNLYFRNGANEQLIKYKKPKDKKRKHAR